MNLEIPCCNPYNNPFTSVEEQASSFTWNVHQNSQKVVLTSYQIVSGIILVKMIVRTAIVKFLVNSKPGSKQNSLEHDGILQYSNLKKQLARANKSIVSNILYQILFNVMCCINFARKA